MKKRISLAICCAALAIGMTGITAMAREATVNNQGQLKVLSDTPIIKEDEEYTISNDHYVKPSFKPTVDGFYTIQKTYTFTDYETGKDITEAWKPRIYKNEDYQTQVYMTADNSYDIFVDISQAKSCKYSFSRVTNTLTMGTHDIKAESGEDVCILLNVTENQTYKFIANPTDCEGDFDVFVYDKNEIIAPSSGYNEGYYYEDAGYYDPDFNCTYDLTPGTYLVNIHAGENSSGTYSVSHSKHSYVKDTRADGTYEMKCECGQVDSENSHLKHTYVKETKADGTYEMKCACGQVDAAAAHTAHTFVTGENTATALANGSITKTCSVCGYAISEATSRLTPTIKLSATKKTIKKKKSFTFKISNLAKGDSIVSVVSNKKAVASVKKVNNAGAYKITGKKKGTAKVIVKLKSGKTAACTVKVK